MPNFPSAFDCARLFVARIIANKWHYNVLLLIGTYPLYLSLLVSTFIRVLRSSVLPPHPEGRGDFKTYWETIEWKRYNRKKKREKGRG